MKTAIGVTSTKPIAGDQSVRLQPSERSMSVDVSRLMFGQQDEILTIV